MRAQGEPTGRGRLALQAAALLGLGLAFAAARPPDARAGLRDCMLEGDCTIKKPNLMIVVDYSSSMNSDFGGVTRWEATVDAIVQMIDADNGFLADNLNVGLMRFGHDPSDDPDTTIAGDTSNPPITDGQALDVHWYPLDDSTAPFTECNGESVKAAVQALPPPPCTMPIGEGCGGIGTWTKGALDRVQGLIAQSRADHGETQDDRVYLNLVLTDGAWTGPDGTSQDAADDPSLTAASLFDDDGVATYVVAVSEGADLALADELAAAGGTLQAIDGASPEALVSELQSVVAAIKDELIQPECVGGMPRIMIVLDASSSMLNDESSAVTAPGLHGWDQAREALAGSSSLFDIMLQSGDSIEDVTQLGLIVFGSAGPGNINEERVLVQYGPCRKDNFSWALNPWASCIAPGCTDPYNGPPIAWTLQDGSLVGPEFDDRTLSHMPQCQSGDFSGLCLGSGTYTHAGLELASANQLAYAALAGMPDAPFPATASTAYANILITDGNYESFSTDAEVQNALEAMYSRGIVTYVLGFGEWQGFSAQLNQMQSWGSGDSITTAFTAANEAELQTRLEAILDQVAVDPCCGLNDCSMEAEPTTNEPDTLTTTEWTSMSESGGSASTTAGDEGNDDGETGGFSSGEAGSGGTASLPTSSGGGANIPVDEPTGCGCNTPSAPVRAPAALALFALLLSGRRRRARA